MKIVCRSSSVLHASMQCVRLAMNSCPPSPDFLRIGHRSFLTGGLTGVGMEPTGKRTSGSIRAKLRHCRPNVPRGLSLEETHTRSNEQTGRVRDAVRRVDGSGRTPTSLPALGFLYPCSWLALAFANRSAASFARRASLSRAVFAFAFSALDFDDFL